MHKAHLAACLFSPPKHAVASQLHATGLVLWCARPRPVGIAACLSGTNDVARQRLYSPSCLC